MVETARDRAARTWFGYGRWEASGWFLGMEPGGNDDHASYESWEGLGGGPLVDCRAHHEDSNHRAGQIVTRWHDDDPPIQKTWGALIRMWLAFCEEPRTAADVATYQRERWGRLDGDTAVIEVSALHARGTDVDVERTLHRSERLTELRQRLERYTPKLLVCYGTSFRTCAYERIVGPFGADLWRWTGDTLCVLAQHPAFRFGPSEPWEALGTWARELVALGPGASLQRPPIGAGSASRSSSRPAWKVDPAHDPLHTIDLIERLVIEHGLDREIFRLLHHWREGASLTVHVRYCQERKGRFHSSSRNADVARRLIVCLEQLDGNASWEEAIAAALERHPL